MKRSILLLLAVLFLVLSFSPCHYWDEYFYLFSVLRHSPHELLKWEAGLLNDGIFPLGYFSGKLGFLVLLRALVRLFGDGYDGLLAVQTSFALIVLGFVGLSFLLMDEIIGRNEARRAGVVLLFFPLTLYFGFKVLSELPALLFGVLACWIFLRSFRSKTRFGAASLLALASVGLSLAVVCRFVVVLMFGAMIVGLLAFDNRRYEWRRLIITSSLVVLGCLAITGSIWMTSIGNPLSQFSGLVSSVTQRKPGMSVKIYAVVMTLQLFIPAFLMALKPPYSRATRLALIWAAICTIPFLAASRYEEPRYFFMALIPLAMLTSVGLERLAAMLHLARFRFGVLSLFAAIVMFNRLVFAPIMPYELNQREYRALVVQVGKDFARPTIVAPWISDYCFLRYAFPNRMIVTSFSEHDRSGAVPVGPTFRRWIGADHYVGSLTHLDHLPRPWVYVGWTFNPTVLGIQKRLGLLHIRYGSKIERRDSLKDHLAESWMWTDPKLKLRPILQIGGYRAFRVEHTPAKAD